MCSHGFPLVSGLVFEVNFGIVLFWIVPWNLFNLRDSQLGPFNRLCETY